ncbi:MAG: Asp-tRNA(Asn)/Glu-tRNA(Gln) amidotransferase subunit GatB [Spirochaetales bacterium]|nr:Asp-tRNA(Asn)/Glu-tRNA(Gln) amidotransferase subunit GatB [Spirochaetales bacterium]
MTFDVVIGCEVHVQLFTETKAFCGCGNTFGGVPNSRVCPVCAGLPGALPSPNARMIEYAVRAGLVLNCSIAGLTKFDRKNYMYPDLPKGYQISQFDMPICFDGFLDIEGEWGSRKIGIIRAHLEEDAGKNLHSEDGAGLSYVDLNRCGTPLLEIVSEPDMRSPEEAVAYVQEIRELMEWIGVSDCNMEEGSLRCDANINLWIYEGEKKYATPITEVKNVNSFRALRAALHFEVKRQRAEWEEKRLTLEEVGKVTRGWHEASGTTILQRHKEEASEYRYFPEPDLKPILVSKALVEELKAGLPELPARTRNRFVTDYGITMEDAVQLTSSRAMSCYFEDACREYDGEPKKIANWILTEVNGICNQKNIGIAEFPVPPSGIRELLAMTDSGRISGRIAKSVFAEMAETGAAAVEIVEKNGLAQISDRSTLEGIVREVIAGHPKSVEDYRNGKSNTIRFLVGQVMKKTGGKANPGMVNEILEEKLKP